jgi:hypothetical protein
MNTKQKPPVKLRANVRLNSLLPQHNTRVRRELLDADYLKKLSYEQLRYYAQFIDEYVGGAIGKTKAGKVRQGYLHDTPELAKKCYDENNSRNRDIYGVSRANGFLHSIDWELSDDDSDGWYIKNPSLIEDSLIANMDSDESIQELSFKEYIMVRDQMLPDIRDAYDLKFYDENPQAYVYYAIYNERNLTENQLDRLLRNPKLLTKVIENSEFMQRKKQRPDGG